MELAESAKLLNHSPLWRGWKIGDELKIIKPIFDCEQRKKSFAENQD
jgi:hypothetical protein